MAYKFIPRLYLTQKINIGENILIENEQHHYISNVLKKQKNDKILIFNNKSDEFLSEIVEISKKILIIKPTNITKKYVEKQQIHLYLSPIHKDKFKLSIEKATELGITSITPVICTRTNAKPYKTEKINATIIMAAQQCERLDIPKYNKEISFDQFIEQKQKCDNEFTIICSENKDGLNIRNIYNNTNNNDIINILIGPEGGFCEAECEKYLSSKNIHIASLGSLILRAETAACVAVAIISSIFW